MWERFVTEMVSDSVNELSFRDEYPHSHACSPTPIYKTLYPNECQPRVPGPFSPFQSLPHVISLVPMSDELNCGQGGGADTHTSLRIASIFITLVGSGSGALFPVLAKRSSWLHVPNNVFKLVLIFLLLSCLT